MAGAGIPGPLALESDVLLTVLCGPAYMPGSNCVKLTILLASKILSFQKALTFFAEKM